MPKAVHQACCCRRRCPTAGKASERKPSRGSTMRAARRGRMGQRHEAKAQALPADGGKGISEAGFWRDVFSVPRPGKGDSRCPAGARFRHFRWEEGTSVNVRRVPVVMRLREDADDGERLLDIVLYRREIFRGEHLHIPDELLSYLVILHVQQDEELVDHV